MIKKTGGIVLGSIKYKDTSLIVKIFTRELGLKSYLINGVRVQGKGSKSALYQPLTLLDLVVYDKENASLQRISDAKIEIPQQKIPFDFVRTGIAMFITEMINRSIYDNYQNEWLFDFLRDSILLLDDPDCLVSNFPVVFLVQQARFLGFAPEEAEGFLTESQHHPFAPSELQEVLDFLESILNQGFESSKKVGGSLRRKLLDHLLVFYSEHLDNPSPIKSLAVLRQLMS